MLLKEERRLIKDKDIPLYGIAYVALRSPNKRTPTRKAIEYSKCEKPYKNEDYQKLYPEKVPE